MEGSKSSTGRWVEGSPGSAGLEPGLTYDVGMAARDQHDGAAAAEAVRVKRLREDARRPISVNLAEGIALSHKLMRFAGAARRA